MNNVRVFFTEVRLWATQFVLPAIVVYLWLKANPKVCDLIVKDANHVKDIIFKGGKK